MAPISVQYRQINLDQVCGYEYHYYCPVCKKEWIQDTRMKEIYPVPPSAKFHIEVVDSKEIYKANNERICLHCGLVMGKRYTANVPKKWRTILE